MSIRDIFFAFERATGVNPYARDEIRDLAYDGGLMVISAKYSQLGWNNPKKVENELEEIRSGIWEIRKQIKKLEEFTRASIRRQDDPAYRRDQERGVLGILQDVRASLADGSVADPETEEEILPKRTREDWVDNAALYHLDELEKCLKPVIEMAIAKAPSGRGRPKNKNAYLIAEFAAGMYVRLTGKMPTYWNGNDTAFSILVEELFSIGRVKADPRKPIEAAMSKLRSKD